jgi:hypothetical protein
MMPQVSLIFETEEYLKRTMKILPQHYFSKIEKSKYSSVGEISLMLKIQDESNREVVSNQKIELIVQELLSTNAHFIKLPFRRYYITFPGNHVGEIKQRKQ